MPESPSISSSLTYNLPDEDRDGDQEDALTVKMKTNPRRAFELQAILRGFGLASRVFDVAAARKRRFVLDGTRLMVDDQRFTGHSFKYFSVNHPLRYASIRIITNHKFSRGMAFLYGVSSALLLSRSDPKERFPTDSWSTFTYLTLVLDRVLMLVFLVDLLLALVSHGVLKCLRQVSYILDIVLLATSVVQEFVDGTTVASTILFSVSALRPLRIISRMKSMMTLLDILFACYDKLLQVGMLIAAICVVFGLAAVIMFRQAAHTRCYDPVLDAWGPSCTTLSINDPTTFLYSPCAPGTVCLSGAPNLTPYSSYDNILFALLVLFQLFTLDNWAGLAVDLMGSLTPAAGVFFVLSTFLLAYWATNQWTAVIFDSFSTTFAEQRQAEDRRLKQMQSDTAAGDNGNERGGADRGQRTHHKGTAPQAHRSILRMKQAIANQSVQSLKRGIRSVDPLPYLREADTEARREQAHSAQRTRSADFFLDDSNEIDEHMKASYRFAQLESALSPTAMQILDVIKQCKFNDERERNLVLNHFHGMSEAAREKCKRFLLWRNEVNQEGETEQHAQHVSVRPSRWSSFPELEQSLLQPFDRGVDPNDLVGDDDDMWEELSSRHSDDKVTHAEKPRRSSNFVIDRQKEGQRHRSVDAELHRLRAEHATLWVKASPILDRVRSRRQAQRKERHARTMAMREDATNSGLSLTSLQRIPNASFSDASAASRGRSERSGSLLGEVPSSRPRSPSSSSSSSSSSHRSSTASADSVDRAIALHRRLESRYAQNSGSSLAKWSDPRHAVAALRAKQKWKSANSLDEVVASAINEPSSDGGGGGAPPGLSSMLRSGSFASPVDRALSVEEHRLANQLLIKLLREHHETFIPPRPKPDLRQRLSKWLESVSLRAWLYMVLSSPWYDRALYGMILLNCVIMLFVYYGMPAAYLTFLNVITAVVDVVVVVDTVCRIVLTSVATYIRVARRNIYNILDVLVTLLCLADLCFAVPRLYRPLDVVRVLRCTKLLRRFTPLRRVLVLVRTSLGYFLNLLLLQVLVWLVFTFCGRQIFSNFHSNTVLQPCFIYRDEASCNLETANCVWANATEFQTWNNTYIDSYVKLVPPFTKTPSRTVSVTTTPPLTITASHRGKPSRSSSRTMSFSVSHSTVLAHNDTSSPTAATTTSAPAPTPLPTHAPASPNPFNSSGDGRRCRQYQGWDTISAFSRFSFETLTFSFISVFDVFSKDNWSVIQYQFMAESGNFSFIFFCAIVIVCGYIVLALLQAILLVNFELKDTVSLELDDDRAEFDEDVLAHRRDNPTLHRLIAKTLEERFFEKHEEDERRKEERLRQEAEYQEMLRQAQERETELQRKRDEEYRALRQQRVGQGNSASQTEKSNTDTSFSLTKLLSQLLPSERVKKSAVFRFFCAIWTYLQNFCDATDQKIPVVEGKSLFLFTCTNPVRVFAVRLVQGEFFPLEKTVFWLTMLHCFVSPASDKLIETPEVLVMFLMFDWILACLAAFDMLMRFVAMGGFIGSHCYWKLCGLGGIIDFVLVMIGFLANALPPIVAAASNGAADGLAIGFALKGVRPFRVVSRSGNMRNVVVAIYKIVPDVLNILGLSGVFFAMISVMLVQAYGGRLRRCSDGSDRSEAECVGNWIATPINSFAEFAGNETALVLQRQWTNVQAFHFDNVYDSFSSMFFVAQVSSWSEIMYAMIDAPSNAGESPQRNFAPTACGWCIGWAIFYNNFLIHIVVGSIVDRFSKLKDQIQGNLFVSAEQSEIARIKKSLVAKTAKKVLRLSTVPFISRPLNELCYSAVSHPWFHRSIRYVLIANVLVIITVHYQQSTAFADLQLYGNAAASVIFLVEGFLKICVAGPAAYFDIKFHFVEAVILVQGVVEIGLMVAGIAPPPWVEVLRLIRLMRLARDAKGLRKILQTGYKALPAMGNIGAVLIALLFFFAMIFIAVFQDARYDLTGNWFSPMFSLRTVPKAMFTLYTVATLDTWYNVLFTVALQPPNCLPATGDCSPALWPSILLNLFVISVTVIMLNLFMAVVLENFSDAVLLPHYLEERQKDVEAFRRAWSRFDNGRNVISAANMVPLLCTLPGPQQRFELLKETRDNAPDDDSAHSLQSEEMKVFAETQTIGFGGCPQGSFIPTLKHLKLVVTMPHEEILYLDAMSAVGEKIYHAQLVDERVRRAHEKILVDAEETQIPFALWYATLRFQKIFKERLAQQRAHNALIAENKLLQEIAQRQGTAAPPPPPRHIASGSSLWNAVLDPIVVSFVRQHFKAAWSATENTKLRKITLTKRGGAEAETELAEDDEMKRHRQAILSDAEKRQHKSLAATIKERQVEVEEAPEVVEDTQWMHAITLIDARDDQGEQEGSLWKLSHRGEAFGSKSESRLRQRVDLETGAICHVATLQETIAAARKELIFQLLAQSYSNHSPLEGEALRSLAQQTTVALRALVDPAKQLKLDVWTAPKNQWTPHLTMRKAIPCSVWRRELGLPLAARVFAIVRKKKAVVSLQPSAAPPLVPDWGVLFRICDERIIDVCKSVQVADDVAAGAAVTALPTVSNASMAVADSGAKEDGLAGSRPPLGDGTLLPDPTTTAALSVSLSAVVSSDLGGGESISLANASVAVRPLTLRERMEQLGMSTVHMRAAEQQEQEEAAAAVQRSLLASPFMRRSPSTLHHGSPRSSLAGGSSAAAAAVAAATSHPLSSAQHRSSVKSVRLLMEDAPELSPTAKALYRLHTGTDPSDVLTLANTSGSYDIPRRKGDGGPVIGFRVLMLLSMAARRFKKRKAEAEAAALMRKTKGPRGAMSVHSKASLGQHSEGRDAASTAGGIATTIGSGATSRFLGALGKAKAAFKKRTHFVGGGGAGESPGASPGTGGAAPADSPVMGDT